MRPPVLSEKQSKILLTLLFRQGLPSLDILKAVGMSASTWNKERMLLCNSGLVESQITRGLTENGVARKMEFKLTEKGRQVAQNLLTISTLIGSDSSAKRAENLVELKVKI